MHTNILEVLTLGCFALIMFLVIQKRNNNRQTEQ